jgi:hypothetical protein
VEKETKEIELFSRRVYLLIIFTIIAFGSSIFKNVINEKWAKDRDAVSCIPQIETHYPAVYIQSAAHPINHDAKMQMFIEEYVHLTRNEQIFDFHKLVTEKDGSKRYDKARLSDAKWKAIFMSKGPERGLNEKKYAQSSDMYNLLSQDRKSIVFLIDEILTFPVPMSMNTTVIVRGQFDAIYDAADQEKQNLPPDFLGYREIKYIVENSFPRVDEKGEWENKPGFYMIWSSERVLNPGEKLLLDKKSRELSILPNDQ